MEKERQDNLKGKPYEAFTAIALPSKKAHQPKRTRKFQATEARQAACYGTAEQYADVKGG